MESRSDEVALILWINVRSHVRKRINSISADQGSARRHSCTYGFGLGKFHMNYKGAWIARFGWELCLVSSKTHKPLQHNSVALCQAKANRSFSEGQASILTDLSPHTPALCSFLKMAIIIVLASRYCCAVRANPPLVARGQSTNGIGKSTWLRLVNMNTPKPELPSHSPQYQRFKIHRISEVIHPPGHCRKTSVREWHAPLT